MTMQVNHISHFLLTRELFPLIKKAAEVNGEARIVNHSSFMRYRPNKKLEEIFLLKSNNNLGGDKLNCLGMPTN